MGAMPRALPLLAALPLLVVVAPFCTVPDVDNTVEGGCGAGTLGIGETCEPRCQEGYAARGTGIGRCRASVSLFLSLSLSRRLCLPLSLSHPCSAAGAAAAAALRTGVCERRGSGAHDVGDALCLLIAELGGGGSSPPVLRCTAAGELEPAGFVCAPYVCPAMDCWSLRSRERPRLQGVCPSCWYGCLDTGRPPTDVFGTVIPNPGTCTIGCRDGFREDSALATAGLCTAHSDQPVPHHSDECRPLAGFQPCWAGNAGQMACVPSDKPCPTAPNASYAGMTSTCVASTCPAPDLGPTLKGNRSAALRNRCLFAGARVFSLLHLTRARCGA